MNYGENLGDWHQYNLGQSGAGEASSIPLSGTTTADTSSISQSVNSSAFPYVSSISPTAAINGLSHGSGEQGHHSKAQQQHKATSGGLDPRSYQLGGTNAGAASNQVMGPMVQIPNCLYSGGGGNGGGSSSQMTMNNAMPGGQMSGSNINVAGNMPSRNPSAVASLANNRAYVPCKGPCCVADPNVNYQHWDKFPNYPSNANYADPLRSTAYPPDNRQYAGGYENNAEVLGSFSMDQRRNYNDYKYRKNSMVPRNYPTAPGFLPSYPPVQGYNFTAGDYQKYPYTAKDYNRSAASGNPPTSQGMYKYPEQGVIVPPKYSSKQMPYQNEHVMQKATVVTNNVVNSQMMQPGQNPYYNHQSSRDYNRDCQQQKRVSEAPPVNPRVQQPIPSHAGYNKYQMYQQKIAMERFAMENHLREMARVPGYQNHPKYQEYLMRYRELLKLQQNVDSQNSVQETARIATPLSEPSVPPINLQFDQNGVLINSNYLPGGFQLPPTNNSNAVTSDIAHKTMQNDISSVNHMGMHQEHSAAIPKSKEHSVIPQNHYSTHKPLEHGQYMSNVSNHKPAGEQYSILNIGETGRQGKGEVRTSTDKPQLDVREFLANWDEAEEEEASAAAAVVLSNNASQVVGPAVSTAAPVVVVEYGNEARNKEGSENNAQNGEPKQPQKVDAVKGIINTAGIIHCISNVGEAPTIHIVDNLENQISIERLHGMLSTLNSGNIINIQEITGNSASEGADKSAKSTAQTAEDKGSESVTEEANNQPIGEKNNNGQTSSVIVEAKSTTESENCKQKDKELQNPDELSLPEIPTSECRQVPTTLNTPTHSDNEEAGDDVMDLSTSTNPIEAVIPNSPMLSFTNSPVRIDPYSHLEEKKTQEKSDDGKTSSEEPSTAVSQSSEETSDSPSLADDISPLKDAANEKCEKTPTDKDLPATQTTAAIISRSNNNSTDPDELQGEPTVPVSPKEDTCSTTVIENTNANALSSDEERSTKKSNIRRCTDEKTQETSTEKSGTKQKAASSINGKQEEREHQKSDKSDTSISKESPKRRLSTESNKSNSAQRQDDEAEDKVAHVHVKKKEKKVVRQRMRLLKDYKKSSKSLFNKNSLEGIKIEINLSCTDNTETSPRAIVEPIPEAKVEVEVNKTTETKICTASVSQIEVTSTRKKSVDHQLDFNEFDVAPNENQGMELDAERGWRNLKAKYRYEDCERYKNPDSYVNPLFANNDDPNSGLNAVPVYTTKDGKITYSPNPRYTYLTLISEARKREGYPPLPESYYPKALHHYPPKSRKYYRRRTSPYGYNNRYNDGYGEKGTFAGTSYYNEMKFEHDKYDQTQNKAESTCYDDRLETNLDSEGGVRENYYIDDKSPPPPPVAQRTEDTKHHKKTQDRHENVIDNANARSYEESEEPVKHSKSERPVDTILSNQNWKDNEEYQKESLEKNREEFNEATIERNYFNDSLDDEKLRNNINPMKEDFPEEAVIENPRRKRRSGSSRSFGRMSREFRNSFESADDVVDGQREHFDNVKAARRISKDARSSFETEFGDRYEKPTIHSPIKSTRRTSEVFENSFEPKSSERLLERSTIFSPSKSTRRISEELEPKGLENHEEPLNCSSTKSHELLRDARKSIDSFEGNDNCIDLSLSESARRTSSDIQDSLERAKEETETNLLNLKSMGPVEHANRATSSTVESTEKLAEICDNGNASKYSDIAEVKNIDQTLAERAGNSCVPTDNFKSSDEPREKTVEDCESSCEPEEIVTGNSESVDLLTGVIEDSNKSVEIITGDIDNPAIKIAVNSNDNCIPLLTEVPFVQADKDIASQNTNNTENEPAEESINLEDTSSSLIEDISQDENIGMLATDTSSEDNVLQSQFSGESNSMPTLEAEAVIDRSASEDATKTWNYKAYANTNSVDDESKVVPKLLLKLSDVKSSKQPKAKSSMETEEVAQPKIPKLLIRNATSRPASPTIEEVSERFDSEDQKALKMKIKLDEPPKTVPKMKIKMTKSSSAEIMDEPPVLSPINVIADQLETTESENDNTNDSNAHKPDESVHSWEKIPKLKIKRQSSSSSEFSRKKMRMASPSDAQRKSKKSSRDDRSMKKTEEQKPTSDNKHQAVAEKIPKVIIKRASASAEFKCEMSKGEKETIMKNVKWQPRVQLTRSHALDSLAIQVKQESLSTKLQHWDFDGSFDEQHARRRFRSNSVSSLMPIKAKVRRLSNIEPRKFYESLAGAADDNSIFDREIFLSTLGVAEPIYQGQIDSDTFDYESQTSQITLETEDPLEFVVAAEPSDNSILNEESCSVIKLDSSDESQTTIEFLPASPQADQQQTCSMIDGRSERLYFEDAIPTQFELELELVDSSAVDPLDVPMPSVEESTVVSHYSSPNPSERSSSDLSNDRAQRRKSKSRDKSSSSQKYFCSSDLLVKEVLAAKETIKKCLGKTLSGGGGGKIKTAAQKKQGCSFDLTEFRSRSSAESRKTETTSSDRRSDGKHSKHKSDVTRKKSRSSTTNGSSKDRSRSRSNNNNNKHADDSTTISLKNSKRPPRQDDTTRERSDPAKRSKLKEGGMMPVLEPQLTGLESAVDREATRSPPVITRQSSVEEIANKKSKVGDTDVSIASIVSQIAFSDKATIKHKRYCNLCERWFPTVERHRQHLKGYQHRHIEFTQRKTIHALFMLFTGKPYPRLLPTNVSRNDGTFGQLTPLQVVVKDIACLTDTESAKNNNTKDL